MTGNSRFWLVVAAVLGAGAVVFGAFGAHAIPSYLEGQGFDAEAVAKRLADFHTAARYHMYGALFLLGVSIAHERLSPTSRAVACWTMLAGVVLFSGSVYAVAMVPDELRSTLGRIAPVGGTLMIIGWLALAVGAVANRPK